MVVTENMALDKKNWTPTSYTEWANNYFLKYVENIQKVKCENII